MIHSGVRAAGRDRPVPQRGDLRILTWNADGLNDQGERLAILACGVEPEGRGIDPEDEGPSAESNLKDGDIFADPPVSGGRRILLRTTPYVVAKWRNREPSVTSPTAC